MAKLAKARQRWEYAIFVGIKCRSGEVWLAADGKIFSARSVRRIPVLESWREDCIGIKVRLKLTEIYLKTW